LSEDIKSLRLAIVQEDGLVRDKPFVFNSGSGYFHGSEEPRAAHFHERMRFFVASDPSG